ncbi:MAG: NrdH-redoxin [Acidimicrobiaceae bacterium]|nr:NrdH-redoxin [Acidimicrobiaceae bacterium]
MTNQKVTVYGALWCPDCRRSKKFLDDRGVPYSWVDVDADERASAYVQQLHGGPRVIPTIVKVSGEFVAEPSDSDLAHFLGLDN